MNTRPTRDPCFDCVLRATAVLLLGGLLGTACGDDLGRSGAGRDLALSDRYLLIGNASVDFQSGSFAVIDLDGLVPLPDLGSLSADSAVRVSNGILLGINRLGGDNLQRLDPSTLETVWQRSVGAGSNPQDVLVLEDGRAYVTRYEETEIWIVDPDAQSAETFLLDRIDLSALADADGIPEMHRLALVGDRVYVTLQRLDRRAGFVPGPDSLLVAIDPGRNGLVDLSPDDPDTPAAVIPYRNPVDMRAHGDELWLACAGVFDELDGGLARFDTTTGEWLTPLATEDTLGGDLAAVVTGTPAVLLWRDAELEAHAGLFEVDTGAERARLADGLAFVHDLEADEQHVYLLDRSPTQPGLRVYRREDGTEVTTEPIPTGLPPWTIEIVNQ